MMPSASIRRIVLPSPKYRLPSGPAAILSGVQTPASIAGPPSPLSSQSPLPAIGCRTWRMPAALRRSPSPWKIMCEAGSNVCCTSSVQPPRPAPRASHVPMRPPPSVETDVHHDFMYEVSTRARSRVLAIHASMPLSRSW